MRNGHSTHVQMTPVRHSVLWIGNHFFYVNQFCVFVHNNIFYMYVFTNYCAGENDAVFDNGAFFDDAATSDNGILNGTDLIKKANKTSSLYTLADIVNAACGELDIRGVSHRGYFATITDFKSYYDANLSLLDFKSAAKCVFCIIYNVV